MRLIDADALIESCLNHCRTEFEIKNCCMSNESVIAIIQDAPTVSHGEWISISERLPEKNVEVLATTESGYVTIANYLGYDQWFIHKRPSNARTGKLIAWMPLPEAYKEAENE